MKKKETLLILHCLLSRNYDLRIITFYYVYTSRRRYVRFDDISKKKRNLIGTRIINITLIWKYDRVPGPVGASIIYLFLFFDFSRENIFSRYYTPTRATPACLMKNRFTTLFHY